VNGFEIDPSPPSDFRSIAETLGNSELADHFDSLQTFSSAFNLSQTLSRLKEKRDCELSLDPELPLIAEHFSEVSLTELSELGVDLIDAILSHPSLQLSSEDSLVELIHDLGSDYFPLLPRVQCKQLSLSSLEIYLDLLDQDGHFLNTDPIILSQLFDRLRSENRASAVEWMTIQFTSEDA
jgi:hypothetical protein